MFTPRKPYKFFLSLCLAFLFSTELQATAKALYVSSYHASFPSVSKQLKGLKESLGKEVLLDTEYIDSKRFPEQENIDRFSAQIAWKIRNTSPYDIIITADDNALRFIKYYQKTLFNKIPIVFMSVNNLSLAYEMNESRNITGIVELPALDKNIELIYKLLPQTTQINVIFDDTVSSSYDWQRLIDYQEAHPYIKLNPFDLSKISFEELQEKVENQKEHEVTFLISFFKDKSGQTKTFNEALRLIRESNRPIFHPQEQGLGQGLLGGKVVLHYKQGKFAGEIAKKILSGESPENIALIHQDLNEYAFDYSVLNKFNIDTALLPDDAKIINKATSNKLEIDTAKLYLVLICIAIAFFISGASISFIRFRKITRALKESELRYANIFRNRYVPMLIIDPKTGEILDSNPAAEELYKYSHLELTKMLMLQLTTTNEEDVFAKYKKIEEQQEQSHLFKCKHINSEGNFINLDAYTRLIHMDGKAVIYAILHKSSIREEWEQAIIAAKEEAEAANKAKDSFLSLMSHELRTPLNPIMGFAGLIKEQDVNEQVHNAADIIEKSSEKMLKTITHILDLTRTIQSQIKIHKSDFNLLELLDKTIYKFNEKLEGNKLLIENGIKLKAKNIEATLNVNSDNHFIQKILYNIIDNAIKYTENGTICIRYGITEHNERAVELLIEIEDTGIGMSEETLEIAFSPFQQADISYTRAHEGTGIGLSICDKMIRLLGGKIDIESEEGKGSKFSIKVPLKVSKNEIKQCTIIDNELNNDEPYKVLIVEDNEENIHYLENVLHKLNIDTQIARNGKEALEITLKEHFNLILMDLNMPIMNGFQTIQHLRNPKNLNANVPMIALSAQVSSKIKEQCRDYKFNEFIEKPIQLKQFKTIIREWLPAK